MDNRLIKKIENEINQRRFQSTLRYNEEMKSLYEKYPELKMLEGEKRKAACNLSVSLKERTDSVATANCNISKYIKENKIEIPVQKFKCTLCNDSGYIYENNIKKRCKCFTNMLIAEAFKDNSSFIGKTFEDFDENVFSPNVKQQMLDIKNYCQAFAEKYPNVKKQNIALCGATGTGKTFLLSCVAEALLANGISVVFMTAGRLFDVLRKYAFSQINDIDSLIEADVLIIDDLGTEPLFNNITLEYIFMLVNERTRLNKSVCISTNLLPDELEARYNERITSRLLDKRTTNVFRLSGDDLRMR